MSQKGDAFLWIISITSHALLKAYQTSLKFLLHIPAENNQRQTQFHIELKIPINKYLPTLLGH